MSSRREVERGRGKGWEREELEQKAQFVADISREICTFILHLFAGGLYHSRPAFNSIGTVHNITKREQDRQ